MECVSKKVRDMNNKKGMLKLLVIIVTYNAMRWIDRCLGSVAEWDVFVVDNGSTDGTQEYIKKNYGKVIFRQSETNLGFGKANNVGLQYALDEGYDYVYLMNQDAWVMPSAISTMVSVSQKHPEYGILSPVHFQANMNHLDYNFGGCITQWTCSHELLEDWFFKRQGSEVYDISFANAAHWLISRKCLMDVGGFSPIFPHYGEDNNYIDRLFYHKHKLGVVCKAIAVHDRENRPFPKEKELYLMRFIAPMYTLSNINIDISLSLLRRLFISRIIGNVAVTIKYRVRLLKMYRKIIKCRERSKMKGAFLEVH